jgi:hypothetical protein
MEDIFYVMPHRSFSSFHSAHSRLVFKIIVFLSSSNRAISHLSIPVPVDNQFYNSTKFRIFLQLLKSQRKDCSFLYEHRAGFSCVHDDEKNNLFHSDHGESLFPNILSFSLSVKNAYSQLGLTEEHTLRSLLGKTDDVPSWRTKIDFLSPVKSLSFWNNDFKVF